MPIYTFAFVITKHSFISGKTADNKEFRTWFAASKLDQVKYINAFGTIALSKFEDFFGVAYPLPKMDMIGVPAFVDSNSQAMENCGIVTYDPQYLLYNASVMTEKEKYEVVLVVTHEISHMWFGNLVTFDWWNGAWLNKGFACYTVNINRQHIGL